MIWDWQIWFVEYLFFPPWFGWKCSLLQKVWTCKQIAAKLGSKASIKDTSLPPDKGREEVKGQVSEEKLLIDSLRNQRKCPNHTYIRAKTLRIKHGKLGRLAFTVHISRDKQAQPCKASVVWLTLVSSNPVRSRLQYGLMGFSFCWRDAALLTHRK